MLFKEKGYDEFLAQKITKGRNELEAGKGVPLEQAKLLYKLNTVILHGDCQIRFDLLQINILPNGERYSPL